MENVRLSEPRLCSKVCPTRREARTRRRVHAPSMTGLHGYCSESVTLSPRISCGVAKHASPVLDPDAAASLYPGVDVVLGRLFSSCLPERPPNRLRPRHPLPLFRGELALCSQYGNQIMTFSTSEMLRPCCWHFGQRRHGRIEHRFRVSCSNC